MTSTQPFPRPAPPFLHSQPPSIRLPILSYYSYYPLPFPPSFLRGDIRLSAKFLLEVGGCTLSFKRTDRQAYEISYPARLFLANLPRPFHVFLPLFARLPLFLFPPRSVPCTSPRLYRLKDVDSASNPLSIPPFGNPAPLTPPPTPFDAPALLSFLRIPYVRGKEFDSVVPARKTPLARCVERSRNFYPRGRSEGDVSRAR